MNYVSILCDLIQMACWVCVLFCFIHLFRERRDLQRNNRFMKQALIDIVNAPVHVGQDLLNYTEIDDYRQVIKELSCDIKRLQGKAYMALDAIDALNDIPEEVE